MKPKLWLLKPDFEDARVGEGTFYCPHCATVEGVLAYYPQLREQLDVELIGFQRPRTPILKEIGEENQACPVLILPEGWQGPSSGARSANGRFFYCGSLEIAQFLSIWAGVSAPHP